MVFSHRGPDDAPVGSYSDTTANELTPSSLGGGGGGDATATAQEGSKLVSSSTVTVCSEKSQNERTSDSTSYWNIMAETGHQVGGGSAAGGTATPAPGAAAATAAMVNSFTIDELMYPLASYLHSMDQLLPHHHHHHHHDEPMEDTNCFAQPPSEASAMALAGVSVAIPSPAQSYQQHNNTNNSLLHACSYTGADVVAATMVVKIDEQPGSIDSDIFDDIDLDLVMDGIFDPLLEDHHQYMGAPAAAAPPPPVYSSPDVVVRLSLKIFACLPTDLPPNLKEELERQLRVVPTLIEGYLRPGCTHVTVDMRVTSEVAALLASSSNQDIIAHLAKVLPGHSSGMLAQLGGDHVVALKEGRAIAAINTAVRQGPRLTALSRVCMTIDEAMSKKVHLYGANIGRPGDIVLCRQHGRHVTVEMMDSAAWGMVAEESLPDESVIDAAAAALDEDEDDEEEEDGMMTVVGIGGGGGEDDDDDDDGDVEHDDDSATGVVDVGYASSVRSTTSSIATGGWEGGATTTTTTNTTNTTATVVKRPGSSAALSVRLLGLKCGVAEVEVQTGGAMSVARPLLLLRDPVAVAEVESLARRARRAVWVDAFIRDAGMVVAHINSEGAAARASDEVISAVAVRTAAYCSAAGCPTLGRLLRRAQTVLRRSMATDDTASVLLSGERSEGGEYVKGKMDDGGSASENEDDVNTLYSSSLTSSPTIPHISTSTSIGTATGVVVVPAAAAAAAAAAGLDARQWLILAFGVYALAAVAQLMVHSLF